MCRNFVAVLNKKSLYFLFQNERLGRTKHIAKRRPLLRKNKNFEKQNYLKWSILLLCNK